MKTHKHHIVFRCHGGTDEPSNLTELNFIQHAQLHAIDFIEGGAWFDCRHEGWPFLDNNLRTAVLTEMSRRTSERNLIEGSARVGKQNGMFGRTHSAVARKKIAEAASQLTGERNGMFGRHHSDEARQKCSEAAVRQHQSYTEEQKEEIAKKKSVALRKYHASKSEEEKAKTSAKRSESVRKSWELRRQNTQHD